MKPQPQPQPRQLWQNRRTGTVARIRGVGAHHVELITEPPLPRSVARWAIADLLKRWRYLPSATFVDP